MVFRGHCTIGTISTVTEGVRNGYLYFSCNLFSVCFHTLVLFDMILTHCILLNKLGTNKKVIKG